MKRILALIFLVATACATGPADKKIKKLSPEAIASMKKTIEGQVTPTLAEGLNLKLWGVDSLVADPVSIDVDDHGNLYYTRTNRQKNSEHDIRGHQDWEIRSIALQSIEDKRKFIREEMSPGNSDKNKWLDDVNHDGSHDWRDMAVEKEYVVRVSDTDGDGMADESQLFIEDFNDEVTDAAGGVMKHGDDLFFNVGPDMWRITDKNGDGLADEKTSISHGYGIHIGFSGHGMSGIEVGPEGKIYWQIGDIGFNGKDKDGKEWNYANSGVVVRSNPDGSDFEVFAFGNRNTHEFVFDEYGNMISEDNDGDHAGESERIVYIVNGADIGWRSNWQYGKYRDPDNNSYKVWMDEKMAIPQWDGQPAYITPTIANFVNGPTGMLYNPGTALSEEWNKTFFIVEFVGSPARSGIHSFKLNPRGATFELGEYKKVLGNVLATGIDWTPDGSMMVADWIDGWGTKNIGRVWQLDVNSPNALRAETKGLIEADFKDLDEDKLSGLLRHADMRVRQKAQFELANRGNDGLEVLKQAITQTDHQLARVHGIWGISQFARKELKNAALLVPLLSDSDPEIKAQAAKWIGDVRYKEAGDQLIALLKDSYPRAQFFAAEALGRTAHEPAVSGLIELLETNNDKDVYIRHAASLALARINKPDALTALSTHPSKAVRTGAVVALRRMANPGAKEFLKDKEEFVATEAARAINDDLSIPDALPALGDALVDYKYTNEAFVRRAINANLRVGTDKAMQNLIDYSLHEGAPVAMRAEAVAALSTWAKPSEVDRVDGRYRGKVTRDLANVQSKSSSSLISLLSNKDAAVRLASAKAIGKLKVAGQNELFAHLKSDKDPAVRVQSLVSLSDLKYEKMDDAIKTALRDNDKTVRVAALDLLPKSAMPKDVMVSLLTDVVNTRTVEERQAAMTTLGSLPLESTQAAFEGLLTKFEKGSLPAEISLELSEALDSAKSQPLIARYKELSRKVSPDTLMGAYAGSLLGGDERRGGRIFYQHQSAQCIRCHAVGDYGGSAGPRLSGIAGRITREQILEALISPSARLAPGFGNVTLGLKNGKSVSGILLQENDKSLGLKIGDRPDTTISKSDITTRTNAASSMPPMGTVLSKRQIRDVVAFLSTLKEDH
ncbi:MAG TPA: HEAT repeat domain-containing protein [Cyclobacteriaceae bacterium]|nr:HEAT repeat domain-containing protein [Cyclobacteriaceae bacterium]